MQNKRLFYVTPVIDATARILLYADSEGDAIARIELEGQEATGGQPYAVKDNPVNARMDAPGACVGFLSQADADEWLRQQNYTPQVPTTTTGVDQPAVPYVGVTPVSVSDSVRPNGFIKDDKGKRTFSLVDPAIMYAIEAVGAVGRAKYSRGKDGKDNWKLAFEPDPQAGIEVYYEAFLRHVVAHWGGDVLDDGPGGTGLPHLYCAAWNLNAVLYGQRLLAKERSK